MIYLWFHALLEPPLHEGDEIIFDGAFVILFGSSSDHYTGKSVSVALILESDNPQYDKKLFIEL